MYAVIETGGKQYKVAVGDKVEVELLAGETGELIELPRVLMVVDDNNIQVGKPTLEQAKVTATVLGTKRGPKVVFFTYRAKEHSRRKRGHRQNLTQLRIESIQA
ncbi:MAG: 50S ribosomal protein L21 [Chloroflexi bacterium]|mgnify:CR=1 FL=1|nr:50S ribosomal protein L21 [Chloroflexota bacterium]